MATPTDGIVNQSIEGCTNAYPVPTKDFTGAVYHAPDGFCAPVNPRTGNLYSEPYYGYTPGLGAGIAFVVLFSLLLLAHTGLWVLSKRLWLVVLVIGTIGELLGWVGRLWSSVDLNYGPNTYNGFLMNIVCLTISPAFFSATAYGIFTLLVAHISSAASRFRPRTLVKVFVGADILSLVLQAAGGGTASGADDGSTMQKTGTHIMVAGIAFQLFSMTIFFLLTVEYFVKIRRQRELWGSIERKVKLLYYGNLLASVLIIIRGIYRTAELAEGWTGYIITHEGYFLGFDAAMMLCCLLVYAIAHPAFLLPKHTPSIEHGVESSGSSTHEAKL